jgi:hypothetical protein
MTEFDLERAGTFFVHNSEDTRQLEAGTGKRCLSCCAEKREGRI